jgi:hypothetical protein
MSGYWSTAHNNKMQYFVEYERRRRRRIRWRNRALRNQGFIGAGLGIGGAAYQAYQNWRKPTVSSKPVFSKALVPYEPRGKPVMLPNPYKQTKPQLALPMPKRIREDTTVKMPRKYQSVYGSTRSRRYKRKTRAKRKRARTTKKTAHPLIVKRVYRGVKALTAKASRYGCVRRVESGGEFEDPDCVYVGHHNCPPREMFDMLCRSIVRFLFQEAGMDTAAWENRVAFANSANNPGMRLLVTYQPFGGDTVITSPVPFDSGDNFTLETFVTALVAQFRGIKAAADDARIFRIELQTLSPLRAVASVEASSTFVYLRCTSMLEVQNRTQSANDPALDPTRNLINDVTNNPLKGYLYHTNGSGFRPRQIFNTLDASQRVGMGFIANNSTGLITARATTTNPSQSKKPFHGSVFQGKVYINKVGVQPGQMIHDKITYLKKLKFDDLWRKISDDILPAGDGDRSYRYIGSCGMFGLEKRVNTRSSQEPNVRIGWELNQTYHMYIRGTKTRVIMPLVSVKSQADVEQNPAL